MYNVNMPKIIDHDKRKEQILRTALAIFGREGYRDSNLSLIAEECGISRPTIYQYFKNKEEIYYYAVKLVTGRMFQRYVVWAWDETLGNVMDRICYICCDIITQAKNSEGELQSLMDVMLQLKREHVDFSEVIMKRTIKLTILIKRMLLEGIHRGEVKEDTDIDMVSSHLFTLLESFCFQIAFLGNFDPEESKRFVSTYLNFFRV
jgi:Transcriptional regulator